MKQKYKLIKASIKVLLVTSLIFVSAQLKAQPSWSVNAAGFANSADVQAVVLLDGVEVTEGILAAFVGADCRGVDDSPTIFPVTGRYLFQFLVYSNLASGETMTFKYYNPADDVIYDVTETISFVSDEFFGDAMDPFICNAITNTAPVVSAAIADQVYDEHFSSSTIDISGVFSDVDGDVLTYSATSSSGSVVSVSVSGSDLIITEVGLGTSTITVTASDGLASVSDVFTVTVNNVNDAPIVANPLADLSPNEGFGSTTVNLTAVFSDPDGNPLTYTASSSNTSAVTVSVSGTTLTITEVAPGVSNITVTASDGSLSVNDVFTVNVNNINDSPVVVAGIADQSLNEHFTTTTIDLSGVFMDPDGDNLTLTPSSSSPIVVTVGISGTTLTINEVGLGSSNITITASDGTLSASDVFVVTVNNVNDAPVVANPVPNQSESEHFGSTTLDISNVFSDPDNDGLTITPVSSNTSVATVSLSGTTLTITEAGVGVTTITLTASDGNLLVSDNFTFTVVNVNDQPVVNNPIADQTLAEHFGTSTINLTGVFSDPDGTALTLSPSSSNPSVVTVGISGNTLTITERGLGSSTITVTASDGSLSVSDVFLVTVNNVNDAPTVANPVADQSLSEHFSSTTINLSTTFTDPDGDALTITATSGDIQVVNVSVTNTTLTITEVGLGVSAITLTATDGSLSVTDQFNVTVNNVNDAPVLQNPVADFSLNEHFGVHDMNLSGVFSDPDGNTLTITPVSSNPAVVSAGISGTTLTLTEVGIGSSTITLTASDGSLSANDAFIVTVLNVNDAPYVANEIPNQYLNEHFTSTTINLSTIFADPDGQTLTLTPSSSNTGVVTVSISGNTLTIAEAGIGISTITVTASDGSLSVDETFTVTVTNVNDAPVIISPVPDQVLNEHFGTSNIDISGVFTDPDNDALILSVVSSNTSVVTAAVIGTTLRLVETGIGISTITLTASDGSLTRSDVFTVTVNNVNDAPYVVSEITDRVYGEGFASASLILSSNFNDPDGNVLTLTAESSNTSVVTVSVLGSVLTITEVGIGSSTITVTASDGFLSVSDAFLVSVNNVNDAPVVDNPIADQVVDEHFTTMTIDLTGVFRDPDGGTLVLSPSSSNQSVVTVSISGATLTVTEKGVGVSTITVSASDGTYSVNDIFTFRVNNLNDAPVVIDPIDDQDLNEYFGTKTINFGLVFSDPDGDGMTYSINSSSTGVVTVSLSGTTLTITEQGLGASIITLTASDGSLSTDHQFIVNVANVNDAPVVANAIADLDLNEHFGTSNLDVSGAFSDKDNNPLTYTASSNNTSVVTVSVSGSTLTITEVDNGSATITVTASDGSLSVSDAFVVTVINVNDSPVLVNPISNRSLNEYFGSVNVDISNVFTDDDGDALTITASSDHTDVVTVSVTGNTLTINEIGIGSATISVVASDGSLTASDEFDVNVANVNDAPIVQNPIPDQMLNEYFGTRDISIGNVFFDKDGDGMTYSVSSSNPSVVTAALSGTTLTLTEIGMGDATITVTASDGSLSVNDQFLARVNNVNDAPQIIHPIADRDLNEHFDQVGVDISTVFDDKDGDALTYSASSANTSIVTVSVSGNSIIITEVGLGTTTITVTASDGTLTADDSFSVTVNNVNDPPVIVNPLSNLSLNETFGEYQVELANVFSEPDNEAITLSVSSSNAGVVTVALSGTMLVITEVAKGNSTITVTATDGVFNTSDVFELSVDDVNFPPEVETTPATQEVAEHGAMVDVDISGVFSDPDGDNLSYTAVSSSEATATVSLNGTTLSITGVLTGSAMITLTASDGEFSAQTTFSVTVTNINDTPILSVPIADRELVEDFEMVSIDISGVFTDPDGDALSYSTLSMDTSVVKVSLSDHSLNIIENKIGNTEIVVMVSDGEFSVSDTFVVTVVVRNKIVVYDEDRKLDSRDTIVICNSPDELILDVKSDLSWSFSGAAGGWMAIDTPSDSTLSIGYSENLSGVDRVDSVYITDTQSNRFLIIVKQTQDCPDGIENYISWNFEVFPNPVEEILYIHLDGAAMGKGLLTVLDVQGRIVEENEIQSFNQGSSFTLSMESYKPGIYIIRLSDDNRTMIRKIVKQ